MYVTGIQHWYLQAKTYKVKDENHILEMKCSITDRIEITR